MVRGYRWVETGKRVWQLEGPPKSRHFHGCVSDNSGWFGWHGGYASAEQGESATKREAMDHVEELVRGKISADSGD